MKDFTKNTIFLLSELETSYLVPCRTLESKENRKIQRLPNLNIHLVAILDFYYHSFNVICVFVYFFPICCKLFNMIQFFYWTFRFQFNTKTVSYWIEPIYHFYQFNFLGSLITTSSGCSTELRRRMAMAKSAMVGLNKIWTDRGITKATKKRLVSALIFPIATYGCESWTLTKADQSRITSFEMWCWWAYVAHLLVYEKIKHQRPGGDTTKKAFTISCTKPDDEIFWTHCKTRWRLLGESHYARLCRREKEAWKT